jgi:hypothetical protein
MANIEALVKQLDRIGGSVALVGPTLAAEKIVRDLQELGPLWSGRFANSWQITGPQGQLAQGTGAAGRPQVIGFSSAPFTGLQAVQTLSRTFFTKDKIVYRISNFCPYADEARDFVPYTPPSDAEKSSIGDPLGQATSGVRGPGAKRGDLKGTGRNRSTAPLDWYTTYAGGGQLDRTIQVMLDKTFRAVR